MSLTLDPSSEFKKYNLSEVETRRAQMLSPETIAYYEHLCTEIAEQLVSFVFSSNPQEQGDQIKEYVRLKANRECLMNLLTDCHLAYSQMAAIAP